MHTKNAYGSNVLDRIKAMRGNFLVDVLVIGYDEPFMHSLDCRARLPIRSLSR